MADETSTGSGSSVQGGDGADASSTAPAAKHHHLRPAIYIDQGPRNKVSAHLNDARTKLTLSYDREIGPQQYESEEYAATLPNTLAWKSAWLRAVSLAWSSDDLKQKLCDNPYTFIHNYCGYAIPRTVNLVVVPDDKAQFVQGDDDTNSWVWYLTQSVLVMYLPQKPQGEDAVVALASYEAVGSAYPFTATC